MIVVDHVSKSFGDVVALSDVSFEIGPGITSLLGPNGAGKSTMIRLMCGLTGPSRGRVTVDGVPPRGHIALYRKLALVPQQESLPETLSASEFVSFAAALNDIRNPKGAAAGALRAVDLDPDDGRRLGTYSKGMRQRVKIAQALVTDPQILVLDEPLNGLDPRQRRAMIETFRALGGEGRCVVVSSHVLDEVERFGSRVLMLAEGRLAAEGDFRDIRELLDDRPHRIRIAVEDPRPLAAALIGHPQTTSVHMEDDAVFAETSDAPAFRRLVIEVASALDVRVFEIRPLDDDLESVFRYLIARR